MAVGGNWPGNTIDNSKLPASMYVDYVRVYQLRRCQRRKRFFFLPYSSQKIKVKKLVRTFVIRFSFLLFILIIGLSATRHHFISRQILSAASIEGRWDITVQANGRDLPSWLEVTHSGRSTLVGQFVGFGGSARPISKVNVENNKFSFAIPPQWEQEDNDLKVEGTVDADNLTGTMTMPNGKTYTWTGTRAPSLRRDKQPAWGSPVKLFNGKNMDGWKTTGTNQWVVEQGVLKSPKSGSNIFTAQTLEA